MLRELLGWLIDSKVPSQYSLAVKVHTVAYAGFSKGSRKFENNEDQKKGLHSDNLARFFCPDSGEDQQKRSSRKFSPFFCQIPKGEGTTQFCALFLGIYRLLAFHREGHGTMSLPPKYSPESTAAGSKGEFAQYPFFVRFFTFLLLLEKFCAFSSTFL